MKWNFLDTIADYYLQHIEDQTVKPIIVVPNIRAGLYLKRSISKISDRTNWAPEIISIQDYFHQQSNLITEEQIPLVFELYKSFISIDDKLFDSFDAFYPWGEMILSDFNDVDKNLVNAKQLFTNVADLKQIETLFGDFDAAVLDAIRRFWGHFNMEQNTTEKTRFLSIWNNLYPVFVDYRKQLISKSIAYEGLIQRKIVEEIDSQLFIEEEKQLYFVGFNVLSQCEKQVFRFYRNSGSARFFWQFDRDLLINQTHEAYSFLREYIKEFPVPEDFNYEQKMRDKEFFIYPVPSVTAQVKLASGIIKDDIFKIDPKFENTAVVLPDEALLSPVLFSIPEEVTELNVSMGFPIMTAPQSGIIRNLASLQENLSSSGFYHKDILRIINHPVVRVLDNDTCNNFKQQIIENNWLRVPVDSLNSQSELFGKLFVPVEDAIQMGEYLTDVLNFIYSGLQEIPDMDFDREIIYQIYCQVNRFNEFLVKDKIHFKQLNTFLNLLNSALKSVKVAFSGEPMKGLQVLGMLETRLLDFENIIILSMNEGHFPSVSEKKSFIPYNLRQAFGLPTIELQDAIHAYYFYRMIIHPSRVHLVYNTTTVGNTKGEMSRYLQQLLVESPFKINEIPVHLQVQSPKKNMPDIPKDFQVIKILDDYCEGGKRSFSPSQLNVYLHCSLAFYYQYILGLKESDELVDTIGALELGNVIHNTMKLLYFPFLHEEVSKEIIRQLLKNKAQIDEYIRVSWAEQLRNASEMEAVGLNALGIEAIKEYIYRALRLDMEAAPFVYLGGEIELKRVFPLDVNGKKMNIAIKGSIDHLDIIDDTIRVLDYKTGEVKGKSSVSLPDVFSRDRLNSFDYYFQTLLYSWLFSSYPNYIDYKEYKIMPVVMYTKKNTLEPIKLDQQELNDFKLVEKNWNQAMHDLLADIMNPDIPFSMTKELKNCEYCPYKSMCY
jgi:hypothetical protein